MNEPRLDKKRRQRLPVCGCFGGGFGGVVGGRRRGNGLKNVTSLEREQSKRSVAVAGHATLSQNIGFAPLALHTSTCGTQSHAYMQTHWKRIGMGAFLLPKSHPHALTVWTHTNTPVPTQALPPISSHIHQSWVRDGLERLNVLIISLDSWSAAVVKNESAISWPPVLLIRKRTIPHHRMDLLPDAWGRKSC